MANLPGTTGYRVPIDDPSLKGANAAAVQALQQRLAGGGGSFFSAGGGYKIDPDQMRALLPQWQDLRDMLDWLRRNGEKLRQVSPPAADEASLLHNKAALAHAELYQGSIEEQWQYATGYVQALETMLSKYEQRDGSAKDAINILGKEL